MKKCDGHLGRPAKHLLAAIFQDGRHFTSNIMRVTVLTIFILFIHYFGGKFVHIIYVYVILKVLKCRIQN